MKKIVFLTLFIFSLFSIVTAQTRGWGFNNNGALGAGNLSNHPSPVTITALPDATGAGAGVDHTLFLKANGTLAVSGSNEYGQFGSDLPASSSSPVTVAGLSNVVQASGGGFHSAALLADGTVWVWGYNMDGQVGSGTTTTTGCLCVTAPTQAGISGVVQIEAGAFHTLALKSDGTVWAWGYNVYGQLGDNSIVSRSTPVQVGANVAGFNNIIAVSAGDNHSMALKSDGTVWIWGSNEFGQLGSGATSTTNQLVPLQNATLSNIVQISAGVFHNIALNKSGRVFAWGDNINGEIGNGSAGGAQTTPVQNTTLQNVIEIEANGITNFARLSDGAVYGWGFNDIGLIGNGSTNPTGCQCVTTPVQTSVGAGNTGIASGWFHAFAFKPTIMAASGANQTLRGDNLRLTFADVTGAGSVSYSAVSASVVAPAYTVPAGYTIEANQPAYDVTTTVAASGNIDVCIAGVNEFSPTAFDRLKILHAEGTAWVDRTISSSLTRREICARVTSLSPFVIAQAPEVTARRAPYDFDGDNKTDVGIFRPSDGSWWYQRSSDSVVRAFLFGESTDLMTPGDFTGDGKADVAFFRPSSGFWFVLRSEDLSFYSFPFGTSGDVPVVGDFDGDGRADAGVYRPSSAVWFILKSSGGVAITTFGLTGDKPVPADYDGDGKTDIAIFRPSDGSWWYQRSTDSVVRAFLFGEATDKPAPGDYTGDGKADVAFFRPSTGFWFVLRSEDLSFYSAPFGQAGDLPVAGDYDGDGRFDLAVFRPSSSVWFVNRSTSGIFITTFGLGGDRPIPNSFVP